MKLWVALLLSTFVCGTPMALAAPLSKITSPDNNISVTIDLDDAGQLSYQLFRQQQPVMEPSALGISLHNTDFTHDLSLVSKSSLETIREHYSLKTGKASEIDYVAKEQRLHFRNAASHPVALVLRVSNDGLAFRYELGGESQDIRVVMSEASSFNFYADTQAWLQPKSVVKSGWMQTNPSYEESYEMAMPVGTASPTQAGWIYPALFHYKDTWIAISEAGMDGHYSGTNLAQNSPSGNYQIRMPQAGEVTTNGALLSQAKLPFNSPWRIIAVGTLAQVYASTLGTDLALPEVEGDFDFVKPGIAAWSWGLLKDDATVYPVQKEFIDYAATMHWPYVLVDADWDVKIGYDKIAELVQYAATKNVALLLWYNSSGAWNDTVYTPKSRLLTRADRRAEFARIHQMGIRGIKVDFFPGDGQSAMHYYQDILADAADFKLMVNFHGATLPRGMQRTYPNFLTSEAIKGFEMITFDQKTANAEASHATTIPFTRNLFDPMDFTPMVLGDIPNIERKTTNGFQLALPVIFTSGIQHLVTTPEQMSQVPDYVKTYLQNIPGQWDESRLLDGIPGKLVVIARRAGNTWYVAAINGEDKAKALQLDLVFMGKQQGNMLSDGPLPRSMVETDIDSKQTAFALPASAGFVLVFNK
ncbi:MAG: glycoside hydrolase family 97 protein [Paraglaciecola sp.]|uniref:glycoside hydrolase family 97 protein n=1 Tax=Pseudomonadati TaxID=3379134 RepID=UPI00273D7DA2|nr:glycoside hydrolase family 97 protein [Paraglaciecola sp.]MDP5030546.1 glycoside hydrolase family 97 protein [Paraglaciecola sp.]MDP5131555.1 glycoside hydrolase family 97 protein [Paraglaciecola sp.]